LHFYWVFFEKLGEDLLRVVEEVRLTGKVLGSFNSYFISLILKLDKSKSCNEFKTISLCYCIYKIISKVLVVRLKKLLSNIISLEQFGFLEGR
jgi:hypothetical protein